MEVSFFLAEFENQWEGAWKRPHRITEFTPLQPRPCCVVMAEIIHSVLREAVPNLELNLNLRKTGYVVQRHKSKT